MRVEFLACERVSPLTWSPLTWTVPGSYHPSEVTYGEIRNQARHGEIKEKGPAASHHRIVIASGAFRRLRLFL